MKDEKIFVNSSYFAIAAAFLISGCVQQQPDDEGGKNKIMDAKFSCENNNSGSIQSRGYILLMELADHHKEGWDGR